MVVFGRYQNLSGQIMRESIKAFACVIFKLNHDAFKVFLAEGKSLFDFSFFYFCSVCFEPFSGLFSCFPSSRIPTTLLMIMGKYFRQDILKQYCAKFKQALNCVQFSSSVYLSMVCSRSGPTDTILMGTPSCSSRKER